MSRCGLQVGVSFHRLWYSPGDVVRATIYVENVPEFFADGERAITFPYQPLFNYFDVDDDSDNKKEMHIKRISCWLTTKGQYDTARLATPPWMVAKEQVTGAGAHSRSTVDFTIFQSSVHIICEDVALSRHQCKAYNCIFKLPDSLPPSLYCSKTAFLDTSLQVESDWDTVYKSKQHKHDNVTQSFPVVLFSGQASVIPFFLSTCDFVFPEEGTPSGTDHLDFKVVAVSAAPTSTLAAPLQNTVSPHETQVRSAELLYSSAQQRVHDSICDGRSPFEYTLCYKNDPHIPLGHLCIDSLQVGLGAHLRGVIVLPSASKDAAEEHPRLVKVTIALEMVECCNDGATTVDKGATVEGMAHTAALATTVKETQEIATVDTPLVPFSISLHDSYGPTILTDFVSVIWQLRLQFFIDTHIRVNHQMVIDSTMPILVVPLTIVPPRIPERPRCCPAWKCL